MARLILMKCPQCGAMLNIEEGRNQAFCTYCGAKLYIDNNNELKLPIIDMGSFS